MVSLSDYNDVFNRVQKHFKKDNPQMTDHQIRLEILVLFNWTPLRGITINSHTELIDDEMYIWINQRSHHHIKPYRIKLIFNDNKTTSETVAMT